MLETFGLVGKMAKGFWVKTSQTGNFKTITGFFVKVSPSTWQSVNDAWVKVKQTGSDAFQSFWQSATNPDTPIEILTSYTSPGELLRLQGKNYHWTPTPSTLFYTFSYVDNTTNTTKTLTSSTSTSNPSTGSSITVPSSSTYRTISKSSVDGEYAIGGVSTYKFTVTGTTSTGAVSVQNAEYSMRTPKAPILSVERLSSTSVKITITAASGDDFAATYRYIVSTYDAVAGTIESGGGRGGYSATSDPTYVTLTGMTAGRLYYIYVTPFTGSAGSTEANATGYAGITANTTTQGEADYAFSFGNTLHVGTNGYVSLDTGSTSDSISGTTGRVIGVFPGDLYQDTAASVWYWSDTTRFIIRWEGYHYGQPSNLRQYEIVFNTGANYASVYAINVANTTEGTEAYVKDGIAKTNYAASLGTGSWRYVYFDGVTTPTSQFGPYAPTSKSVMKQVTGLTTGTQDQGYTSIVTSTNQNVTPALGAFNVSSFTKNAVSSSSQGASRSTTLTWGSSTNATRYEIQYQGSNDNTNWTTVQTYGQSAFNTGTSETKTWSTSGGNFSFYTFIRANIRASESTATAAYVYSDSGSYVDASGTAPGQPSFGSITKTATTASIPVTVGSSGSNYLYLNPIEYQYRTSSGSYSGTWTSSSSPISLTGLSGSTTYYIKIRTKNYDELVSPENETNFTTTAAVSTPTSLSTSINASNQIVLTFSGGSGDQYDVFYANSNTRPTDQQAAADFPNVTSPYIATTLTGRDMTRWFWVRTSSGTVRSNWFPASPDVVTARIPLYAPPTPTITNSAIASASLSWYWDSPTPNSTQDSPTSWDYAQTTSSTSPTSGWTNLTTRPTSASPLVISSLSSGTDYYLHVKAKNADASTLATPVKATTTSAPVNTSVPTLSTDTNNFSAGSTITVNTGTWTGANSYKYTLNAANSAGTTITTKINNSSTTNTYVITNLDAKTTSYYFIGSVTAYSGASQTGSSASANTVLSDQSYISPSTTINVASASSSGFTISGIVSPFDSTGVQTYVSSITNIYIYNSSQTLVATISTGLPSITTSTGAWSYTWTGGSASTGYYAKVKITANDTAATTYTSGFSSSITTTAAFVAPTPSVPPSFVFSRNLNGGTSSTRRNWFWNVSSGTGSYNYFFYELYFYEQTTTPATNATPTSILTFGSSTALPATTDASTFNYSGNATGLYRTFGRGSSYAGTNGNTIAASSSVSYGKSRFVVVGTNGTTYNGTFTGYL